MFLFCVLWLWSSYALQCGANDMQCVCVDSIAESLTETCTENTAAAAESPFKERACSALSDICFTVDGDCTDEFDTCAAQGRFCCTLESHALVWKRNPFEYACVIVRRSY
jgi:hypothetical protein